MLLRQSLICNRHDEICWKTPGVRAFVTYSREGRLWLHAPTWQIVFWAALVGKWSQHAGCAEALVGSPHLQAAGMSHGEGIETAAPRSAMHYAPLACSDRRRTQRLIRASAGSNDCNRWLRTLRSSARSPYGPPNGSLQSSVSILRRWQVAELRAEHAKSSCQVGDAFAKMAPSSCRGSKAMPCHAMPCHAMPRHMRLHAPRCPSPDLCNAR